MGCVRDAIVAVGTICARYKPIGLAILILWASLTLSVIACIRVLAIFTFIGEDDLGVIAIPASTA